MEIILIIVGLLFIVLGLIGDFLPVLPGPILSYLALFMIQLASHSFSSQFMIIMAIVAIIITTVDYIIPVLGTKKMGGTKRGTKGSTIGLIVGVIILPILGITIGPFGLLGLLGGPFLGAYIGERLQQKYNKHKSNNKKALKAAFGAFLGFISGILLKLAYTIIIGIYLFPQTIEIIKKLI